MKICSYTIDRYDDVMALMRRTPGLSIRDADSRPATERYLARNPGMSFLCIDGEQVVGCAMCGHDGRRGYLQHVIVDAAYRGRGIADELVENCLVELGKVGIEKPISTCLSTTTLPTVIGHGVDGNSGTISTAIH
jgi:ribosomal protein S18 acetylase RimI-like enzyme